MPQDKSLDFIVVGVQKAGTTFLASALANNTGVCFSDLKELFFFGRKVNRWQFNTYIYENFWKAQPGQLVGEGTTTYFHDPRACKQILHYLGPKLKIIVCLRHPIERMLSHYLHDYKRKRRRGDESIMSDEFATYRERSKYADSLMMWQAAFEDVHVMLFDDLVKSGSAFFQEAADFLGIAAHPIVDRPVNEGIRLAWNGDELTTTSSPKHRLMRPAFSRGDLEQMLAIYAPDVDKTSRLIGRDLSSWHDMPSFGLIQAKFNESSSSISLHHGQ